jgi:NADPH-dependent 2,4-dienoyl-CoA reductase/sulfur reductase-like enzyme
VHDIFETPRALSTSDIKEQELRYMEAVVRAKKAGFDAVELHCAHGYLINQFLSPNSNHRTDEYGGDLKNRARFLLETIAEIKKAVGNAYPIICRINGDEPRIENGSTVKDAQEIAKLCQDAGVAAIDVSCLAGPDNTFSPMVAKKKGFLLDLAAAVKKAVTIPVMAVYRLTPEVAEQAINEGKADIAIIGRGLLADPEMPNKVARGKMNEVTPCIVCNTCQYNLLSADDNIKCRVNPAAGKERDMAVARAKKTKKIAVVGGGPAGLEAAIVAARRGHKVTLFEKEKTLGGQLIIAAVPPHKEILVELIDSLSNQAKGAGVNIILGDEATAMEIHSIAPDEIVLATGILPFVPDIRGVHSPNVVSADDVLAGKATVGNRVIVLGGELVGCETAEMLAGKGKKVTITRRGPEMAVGLSPMNRASLLGRLQVAGVTMMPSVIYNEITSEGLKVIDKDGKMQTLPADTIVLAAGYQPNTKLFDVLNDRTGKVHCIGDCQKPRSLLEAMIEGHGIGRSM